MFETKNGKLHFTRPFIQKNQMNLSIESLLFFLQQRIYLEKRNKEYKPSGLDNGFIPRFQRDLVWTLEQKQKLILSIMDNLPIGTLYMNRVFIYKADNSSMDYAAMAELDTILYDGQQRFNAIKDFLVGKFPIVIEDKEAYIHDFDDSLRSHILTYTIPVIETAFDNLPELVDYYIKINRGGTLHTEADIQKALDAL